MAPNSSRPGYRCLRVDIPAKPKLSVRGTNDADRGEVRGREKNVQFLFHYERAGASAVDTIQARRAGYRLVDQALVAYLVAAFRI